MVKDNSFSRLTISQDELDSLNDKKLVDALMQSGPE